MAWEDASDEQMLKAMVPPLVSVKKGVLAALQRQCLSLHLSACGLHQLRSRLHVLCSSCRGLLLQPRDCPLPWLLMFCRPQGPQGSTGREGGLWRGDLLQVNKAGTWRCAIPGEGSIQCRLWPAQAGLRGPARASAAAGKCALSCPSSAHHDGVCCQCL